MWIGLRQFIKKDEGMYMERQYVEGRVSVITPVYNAERYIEKTLNSVFSQSFKDIEVVLVDDCSKDCSAEIIQKYKANGNNIIYYLQVKNMGAGAARNKALELSSGRYVAFLDSDDLWMPNKIEAQMKLMIKTGTPFSYTAIEMIDEDGKQIKPKRNIKETCDYRYLLHNTIIATSSVIIDRKQLGDFRMPLRRGGQDYATWLMLLRNGVVAEGINKALVQYRVSSNSLSSNKFKSIKQIWEIQTQDENICSIVVMKNICLFCVNAAKKYFM